MAKARPRRSITSKTKPVIDEVEETEEDWLASGADVDKAIKKARANARPKVREFFFVKDELNAETDPNTGRAKPKGTASALTHFVVNYADTEYKVILPRISIKEGKGFKAYTSIGGDCAIQQATGKSSSLRPVYFLIDHRSYENDAGDEIKDTVKTWIPTGSMMDLLTVAIDNLCDAVQIDRDEIDLTQYPLKITKSGSGRKSVWSVSFIPRVQEFSDEAWERSLNFIYGKDEVEANDPDEITYEAHKAKVRKLLAPDPRYMLSKGGSYTVAAAAAPVADGTDDVPY